MRRLIVTIIFLLIVAFLFILIAFGTIDTFRSPFETFAENEEFHDGDLIIENSTYTIDNKYFKIKGNIFVKNNGKLIIRNSNVEFMQDYNTQYYLKACTWDIVQSPCSSELVFDNVKFFTNGKWMTINYGGKTNVTMNRVNSWNNNGPWHSSAENVNFKINNSVIGITPGGNTTISAENTNAFFELYLSYTNATFRLPQGETKSFGIDARNEDGTVHIKTKNTYFRDWGATLNKHNNITFIDSSMTIGINAGSDWTGNTSPVAKVSGLKNKVYGDLLLDFDTNHLRLINTKTRDWYPQGRSNSTIEISDSDLADINYNGETATIIVKNSNAAIAVGRDNVTYIFYDSKIAGDVSATMNSKIYLYNTKVGGNLNEAENGQIYIDGKRLTHK